MTLALPPTLGLVLAGGQATRMGGADKALLTINGVTLLQRVLSRFKPQCADVILNANGDPARLAPFGLPVVADEIGNFAGPLAGLLAGMDWAAAHRPDTALIASVPGDCPFLPHDLVARLHAAKLFQNAAIAYAKSGEWRHPVVGLWPVALRDDLRHALTQEKLHKVELWAARHRVAIAEWPVRPIDPFFNVNDPGDRAAAEALAAKYPDA